MKKILRSFLIIVSLPIIYLSVVILIATLTRYEPEPVEQISKIDEGFTISDSATYSVLIWNIGYAGLGANMDFFYDGGSNVRDSEDNVRRNLFKITEFLQANDSIDFILLQEVDKKSKRSYRINMEEHFNEAMASHFPFYALNYKVAFVPMPLLQPMGKVHSGLLSLMQHVPVETSRHTFPSKFSWPTSLFMLERCFIVNRFKTDSGKELIIINTHNSSFDDGSLRLQQMNQLKDFLSQEEEKGSAFIVGGDWNQCPSDFQHKFSNYIFDTVNLTFVNEGFLKDNWSFNYDAIMPTNRRVNTPFNRNTTSVTLIDFFLTSTNIEVLSCRGVNLGFANSDHQPLILTFKMK